MPTTTGALAGDARERARQLEQRPIESQGDTFALTGFPLTVADSTSYVSLPWRPTLGRVEMFALRVQGAAAGTTVSVSINGTLVATITAGTTDLVAIPSAGLGPEDELRLHATTSTGATAWLAEVWLRGQGGGALPMLTPSTASTRVTWLQTAPQEIPWSPPGSYVFMPLATFDDPDTGTGGGPYYPYAGSDATGSFVVRSHIADPGVSFLTWDETGTYPNITITEAGSFVAWFALVYAATGVDPPGDGTRGGAVAIYRPSIGGYAYFLEHNEVVGAGAPQVVSFLSDPVSLLAGDTIHFGYHQNRSAGTSLTMGPLGDTFYGNVSIARVGP